MQSSEQGKWAGAIVHGDWALEGFGHAGDLTALGDTACPGRIDHDDVGGALLQHRLIFVAGGQIFAGQHRGKGAALQFG